MDPTGSTGTRFFVKRLKRGTQYTFGVRGRNSEGAGDASILLRRIHRSHRCITRFSLNSVSIISTMGRECSEHGNPSNIIRAVADNNYQTFTREKDLVTQYRCERSTDAGGRYFCEGHRY